MTPGPKSQLLAGIVVDTIPGPVSLFAIGKKSASVRMVGNKKTKSKMEKES